MRPSLVVEGRSEIGIRLTVEGAVATIELDRPPANAYDAALMAELETVVQGIASDASVRVAIVRSASPRFFSAGADVKGLLEGGLPANEELGLVSKRALAAIEAAPQPFIAQIAGHALGGGLELALVCDLRLAADGDYRLGLPEVTLGLIPGAGGTQRLPRLIGAARALDLVLSGRTLDPREALELGILTAIHPASELEPRTREYAERLAAGASLALAAVKRAIHAGMDGPLEDGLRLERELSNRLFSSADAREGLAAFTEKRTPTFVGR